MNIEATFSEHAVVMREAAATLAQPLAKASALLGERLASGRKVMACGNGGSAASAQHFVAELVCRFRDDRRALPAIALTADTMTMTAIGNDYGYQRVFARQIEAIGAQGDILVALSTSGNSENVLEAVAAARATGCSIVALTGADGGKLAPRADIALRVPSRVVARIQEVHAVCIHVIAEAIEEWACRVSRS